MFQRRAVVLMLLSLALAACGGGAGSSRGDAAASICIPLRVVLVGDLNGHPVDVAVRSNSSSFQQATPPYTFEVVYADGTAHLQWVDTIGSGQTAAASGTV